MSDNIVCMENTFKRNGVDIDKPYRVISYINDISNEAIDNITERIIREDKL